MVNDQAYLLLYRRRDVPFGLPRRLAAPVAKEAMTEEPTIDRDPEETPMSVSTTSQPSTSSADTEEMPTTVQEELD